MPRYDCGCINDTDPGSGVLRSVVKCQSHRREARDPRTLDAAYYAGLHGMDELGDNPAHVEQIESALGPFPHARGVGFALEVGCGCSSYAGAIEAAGWTYFGIDASPFACVWTAARWGVSCFALDFESRPTPPIAYGLILAAHSLEHMRDAPGALRKIAASLEPGGELRIVVPDDSDPVNPDHLWHFTRTTLPRAVEAAGLEVAHLAARKVVEREEFLYLRARKP